MTNFRILLSLSSSSSSSNTIQRWSDFVGGTSMALTKALDLGPSLVSGMLFMPRHATKLYAGFGRMKFEGPKFWKCWEERNWGFLFSVEDFWEETEVCWLCLDSAFLNFGCGKCENKMRNLCCLRGSSYS